MAEAQPRARGRLPDGPRRVRWLDKMSDSLFLVATVV